MKKLSKLLTLALVLTLLVGVVFAVTSSAADEPTISIEGASRTHQDFTGASYDEHKLENVGVDASPVTTSGKEPISSSKKYGHFRTITLPDGNTVFEYVSEKDYPGYNKANDDIWLGTSPVVGNISDGSYFIVEYDMATRTRFPGNATIYMETRYHNGSKELKNDAGSNISRNRPSFGQYNAETGKWVFGSNEMTIAKGQWVHITLITKINAVPTTNGDVTTVNYGTSVTKLYVNGQYMSEKNSFLSVEADPSYLPRLQYAALGWVYGTGHTGTLAGDSMVIDNATYTVFDTVYSAPDANTDKLAPLFAAENPVTDITELGEEVMWHANYKFPSAIGTAEYAPEEGEEYLKGTFEEAYGLLKEEENDGATIKLYANNYNPVVLDYPVVVDMNGYELQNGWIVPSHLSVNYDAEAGLLEVAEDPDNSATFEFYSVPFADKTTPVFTQMVADGRDFVMPDLDSIKTDVIINGKVGKASTGVFKVYNEAGEEVEAPSVIGEENIGQVYYICPVFAEVTLENDITFYTILDGKVTFYDNSNIWSAATPAHTVETTPVETTDAEGVVTKTWTSTAYPVGFADGLQIVLVKDCTASTQMYSLTGTFSIDLNGHALTSTTNLLRTNISWKVTTYTQVGDAEATSSAATVHLKNNKVYIYSSVEGASISTGKANLFLFDKGANGGATNGVAVYIGYTPDGKIAKERMDIHFGQKLFHLVKGDVAKVYFANADMYSGDYHVSGLISAAQSRGLNVYFDDVNLFTNSPLFGSTANSGKKNIYMTNTNVYAQGDGLIMNYLKPEAGGDGHYVDGATNLTLKNSKIYDMEFGHTQGDGLSEYKATFSVSIDETSMISAKHARINPTSGVLVAKPEVVTINGQKYVTLYAVGTGEEETATFNVYDVSIENLTADVTPVETLDIVAGYWFASYKNLSFVYDYANDPYHTFTPKGYAVYDSEGNVVTTESAVAGATYSVCVVYEIKDVKFVIIDAQGNVTPYVTDDLIEATTASDKGNYFPEGSTVVLLSDCYASINLYLVSCSIDLNGFDFYKKEKQNTFIPQKDATIFVYSSREGARLLQGPINPPADNPSGCGYVLNANADNNKFYFGYKDAETFSPYRIEVFCGAFAELKYANTEIHLGNLDVYKVAGDNYGFFNIRGGSSAERHFFAENCNFYGNFDLIVLRECTGAGSVNFKGCNFYANGNLLGYQKADVTTAPALTVNIEDTNFYGTMKYGSVPQTCTVTVNIKGDFKSSFIADNFVYEEGKIIGLFGGSVTTAGTSVPAKGVYGAEETLGYASTYYYQYSFFSADAYKASAFQNMTLSTNVIGNLYIPVMDGIISATLNGVNILNTEAIEVIGGKEYYILSFGVAPKYGDRSLTITVNFLDGVAVDFEMSVANYAKALLGIAAGDNAYIADSQEMMKYILNYIKEVAVEFGGADAETIFADLGDIAVNADVTVLEEVKDTTDVQNYVTHAALNLDAYAGFAFKVAQGFVGEVKIELAGVAPVEAAYTADAPAGENEVIVLENVPARLFRGDVTITVTPAEGEAVIAEYNLATYVSASEEAYAKAFYAYTVKAEEYYGKYPTVGTVD